MLKLSGVFGVFGGESNSAASAIPAKGAVKGGVVVEAALLACGVFDDNN